MTTRTTSFLATAILILLGVLGLPPDAVAQEATTMPDMLEPRAAFEQRSPFWVSARVLNRDDGEAGWEVFQPGLKVSMLHLAEENAEELRKRGNTNAGACAVFLGAGLEDPALSMMFENFDSLMRNSIAIVRGKILEIDVGIVESMLPGSLLRIRVESTLFSKPDHSFPQEILVAYKQAALTIGDLTYCSTTGDGYEPAVGDQLIYFSLGPPCDTTGQLFIPNRKMLAFADPSGQLVAREDSLEETLLRDGKRTLDDLAGMIAEAVKTGKAGELAE